MNRQYHTRNIEQAAAIQTVSKIEPVISWSESRLATFTFPSTEEVINAVLNYESGISVDARTCLDTRNQLFKRAKGVRQ